MIDIHNYEAVIEYANKQARNFKKPKNFCGGRFQTEHDNIFLHINSKGELSKIEISKEGGSKFYLTP
ncbi:MAG: hypothetical protein ACE5RH_01955 [Nitrosarchaeum sp.]